MKNRKKKEEEKQKPISGGVFSCLDFWFFWVGFFGVHPGIVYCLLCAFGLEWTIFTIRATKKKKY